MSPPHPAVKVFCSYAHQDEDYRQQLENHLSALKRQGLISLWHDRQIPPGMDWAEAIDSHLESASVIILLISADFIASDYCYGIEMKRALERHKDNEARVIPIIMRPVDWKGVPFAHLQALPTNARPVTTWSSRDEAFADVATGIRRAIEDFAQLSASFPRREKPVREVEDSGKYQTENQGPVQGLVMGEGNIIHQHFSSTNSPASAPATHPEQIWNIPFPRPLFFTGREDLLLHLQEALQTGRPQALTGLGGIGKTQVAVGYANWHGQDYQAVLWARAESREALTSSFVEIAARLHLPEKNDQDQMLTVKAVMRWLQANSRWLLILDNAEANELAMVREFLPNPLQGHLLLTTRAHRLGDLAECTEVSTFTPELGALFLLRRASIIPADAPIKQAILEDRKVAMQISQELGGLPLALDQAGAYIQETRCRLLDYLKTYQTHHSKELLARRGLPSPDYPYTVMTTWSLSFLKVETVNLAAADLLRLCAFLAPDAIPEELIRKGASYWSPPLQQAGTNPVAFNQAIAELLKFSLVKRDQGTETLSIHRLVQKVFRDTMSPEEKKQCAEQIVHVVNATFPSSDQVSRESWLPHVLVCKMWIEEEQMVFPEAADLLFQIGHYLYKHARYTEAEQSYQHSLDIRVQRLGPEHPQVAYSLNGLAILYSEQGKYEEAKPLYQRALHIWEQALGSEHPQVAYPLNGLAVLYSEQGKNEEAKPLYQRALHIWEQALGSEHPQVAYPLNGLAILSKMQGNYKEAEEFYRRALDIRERSLSHKHPDVAQSLNSLAVFYAEYGKYSEAVSLFKRSLSIREVSLGPEHPDVAQSLNNLANLYTEQSGKYTVAESLFKHFLDIFEQSRGSEHPDVIYLLNGLALLYSEQDKYKEAVEFYQHRLYAVAEELYQRSLYIFEQSRGSEHPDVAYPLNGLAILYSEQGKYKEAEELYQRSLDIRVQRLGYDHPQVAYSLNNQAILSKLAWKARSEVRVKYEDTEPLFQRSLHIFECKLGLKHPHTRRCAENYADLLRFLNRDAEAQELEKRYLS